MKLEARLTLLATAVTASTLAVCLFTGFWFVKRAAATELDELVLEGANAIALVVAEREGQLDPSAQVEFDVPEHAVRIVHHVAVFDRLGNRVAQTAGFDGVPTTLQELARVSPMRRVGKTFDLRVSTGLMRAVVMSPVRKPEFRVLHAVPRDPTDVGIAAQRRTFLALFGASLAVVILGSMWLGRRLASEVLHVTDVARRVGSGELSARAGSTKLTSPEVRNLARELDKMIAELLALLSSQRSFISYAAHELRSPLTALQGELQLALRRTRSVESYVETLGTALTEVEALAQLAEDLLMLARAQSQTRGDSTSRIGEIVDEAMRLVQGSAQIKETEVIADISTVRELDVVGAKADLARALRNLLENAIKFGPPRGEVQLSGMRNDASVLLLVKDQGPGVSPRDVQSLFQPFFRGTSRATGSIEGTGLGLAITREIARNLGGDVKYSTTVGSGAVFELELLLAAQKPADESTVH